MIIQRIFPMSIVYDEVLYRLKEERTRLGLSQEALCKMLYMTQSHYSKVELGTRYMGFHELNALCDSGLDVNYIYTNRKPSGKYGDILSNLSYYQLYCVMNCIWFFEAAVQGRQFSGISDFVRYIPLDRKSKSDNLFFLLRQTRQLSQIKMAQILGMDVKKYRALETNKRLPDSEILFRMYKIFHIPPSVILKDENGIKNEIYINIEMIPPKDSNVILEIIHKITHTNDK